MQQHKKQILSWGSYSQNMTSLVSNKLLELPYPEGDRTTPLNSQSGAIIFALIS